jgi:thymidylate synthase ThyX
MKNSRSRVVSVSPMPPEKCAYALARYSRSPDSIRDSIEWVRTHNSQSFLESYYFQYGHQSIADLGHTVLCFEGISELAASEVEDETLWDGQAKSSRYQDFSRAGFITPPEFREPQAEAYRQAVSSLLSAYGEIHAGAFDRLKEKLPRPETMKPEAYERNLRARAFDVARYLLFWGVPTQVGQVTSIRTLEKQIRRLRASEYAEVRVVAEEISGACAAEPECRWDEGAREPLAPTLARHAGQDRYALQSRADLTAWAAQNLPPVKYDQPGRVDLICPEHAASEIVATLLYSVTDLPFRVLYGVARDWSEALRDEVIDVACRSRKHRDELLRGFRGGQYVFDMLIDVGAYRDMHRHRRCHQLRQAYSGKHGYETPALLLDTPLEALYRTAMEAALATLHSLPAPGAHYLLPFGARSRFLFKMDFAEAEYISRVRSGVKGHFSYREIAWEMKQRITERDPSLGRLIEATPPWVEDPLVR